MDEKRRIKNSEREKPGQLKIQGWRLWLFRFIAFLILPVFLILVLEISLRLAGYGYNANPIIKTTINGQKVYRDNVKFGRLFFPPNIAREYNPFIFPVDKPAGTCRIFVFGSSAALGAPDSAYGFARMLKLMLDERYPAIKFEVLNTSMTAINSNVVVEIAKECAKHQPDFFVVYMGNNEVIGPYGAGTVFAPISENLFLIHLGTAVKKTRVGQLVSSIFRLSGQKKELKVWGGLQMFLEKQVAADDKRLQAVYRNYTRNLQTISGYGVKGGANVILTTVASNLKDCPPFASLHRKDLSKDQEETFRKLYSEGLIHEKASSLQQAIEKYLDAERIDPNYAELQFSLGNCFYNSGQFEQARDRYIKARELDTIRFRADNTINRIITEVASKDSTDRIFLVDAIRQMEQQSPHQIPGNELFYEHVHMTFTGNYVLAKAVFEQIAQIMPGRFKNQEISGQPVLSEDSCRKLLAFTDWNLYVKLSHLHDEYIKNPPFTNQLNHQQDIRRLRERIDSLKKALNKEALSKIAPAYEYALQKNPDDWMLHYKYGDFLMDSIGDYTSAMMQFNRTLELVPHFYLVQTKLGIICARLGDFDRAIGYFHQAVAVKQSYAPAYFNLGLVYQKKKMSKEAKQNYKKAIEYQPNHVPSYVNLGVLLDEQGRLDDAIELTRKGIEFQKDSTQLHYNLGCYMKKKGLQDDAVKEFQTVLIIDPEHKLAKQDLDEILKKPQ